MSLARRKKIAKRMKKSPGRRRKPRPKKAKPPPSRGFEFRTLVAILVLLYMLKLIDEKTLTRMTGGLYPKRAVKKRRRRRRTK